MENDGYRPKTYVGLTAGNILVGASTIVPFSVMSLRLPMCKVWVFEMGDPERRLCTRQYPSSASAMPFNSDRSCWADGAGFERVDGLSKALD